MIQLTYRRDLSEPAKMNRYIYVTEKDSDFSAPARVLDDGTVVLDRHLGKYEMGDKLILDSYLWSIISSAKEFVIERKATKYDKDLLYDQSQTFVDYVAMYEDEVAENAKNLVSMLKSDCEHDIRFEAKLYRDGQLVTNHTTYSDMNYIYAINGSYGVYGDFLYCYGDKNRLDSLEVSDDAIYLAIYHLFLLGTSFVIGDIRNLL